MKKIAIVFSNAPYGNSLGLEGLDFVLSASCFTKNLGLFFIGDGIFQLLKNQNPSTILFKDYTPSFKILSLCKINDFYLCYDSLKKRGFTKDIRLILKVNFLSYKNIRSKINEYNFILNF